MVILLMMILDPISRILSAVIFYFLKVNKQKKIIE